MATKAFQKIYTKISQITKATCSLKATGVGYDELAMVNGKLAQVVKIAGDEVTLQVFEGTEGIPTNAEVVFLGKSPTLKVSEQLAGRFFNAFGDPIDGGPEIEGVEVEIGGPSVNPVRRKPAVRTDRYGYCWYRLEQHPGIRTEDPLLCRSGPAFQPGDGQCGLTCRNRQDYSGRYGYDQ